MRLVTKFEKYVNELGNKLSSSVVVSEDFVKSTETFRDTADGIKSTDKKRNGRSDAEIDANVLQGKVAEVGIAELLQTEVFEADWELGSRASYSKDVVYNGIRIEVKSHKSLRHFSIPDHSYNTMINNRDARELDVVLFAHVERLERYGYWRVSPTLIVDPFPEIIKFSSLWDIGSFKTKVYRADLASPRDLCFPLIDLEA